MKNIYCISGLGADHRIFGKLKIEGAKLVPVHWTHFSKHDDLPGYARKLSVQIQEEEPFIMGVSFGGMLASEIAKIIPARRVFLISSAKTAGELPHINRFLRFIIQANLLPVSIMKSPVKQVFDRFGVTSVEEKALLTDIMAKTDGHFIRWAAKAMINWRSDTYADNIIHIHGTADRIISPEYVHPTHWVKGGGHLMVYQRAKEVSRLIMQHLLF